MKRIFALLLLASASSGLAAPLNYGIFSNASPIAINDSVSPPTAAAPYPATLNVSGLTGIVAKVSLQLNNLGHGAPNSIGMLLVAPSGQKAVVFSGVGGTTAATNITLTLDDDAPSALPNGAVLVSGIFRPAGYSASTFPSPAPAPGSSNALATFKGISPNGTWNLYVVNNQSGNTGSVAGGWSLIINTTVSFTNSAFITINDSVNPPTLATPYPGIINVSNLTGQVSKVTAKVYGLTHDFPSDIDMLLVDPQAQNVVLWGEAGGGNFLPPINVNFDDSATQSVPDDGTVTSKTYKPTAASTNLFWPSLPTNIVVTQTFTPMLAQLTNSSPNGAWSLYIVDDMAGGSGSITNGWSLTLTMAQRPTLNLQLSGTNAILSWPATALGATLQSSTNAASTNPWTTVTPGPTYVAGQNFVTNGLGAGPVFYRLFK